MNRIWSMWDWIRSRVCNSCAQPFSTLFGIIACYKPNYYCIEKCKSNTITYPLAKLASKIDGITMARVVEIILNQLFIPNFEKMNGFTVNITQRCYTYWKNYRYKIVSEVKLTLSLYSKCCIVMMVILKFYVFFVF